MGLDIRYVVTNIATGTAEWLYAELYCQRGRLPPRKRSLRLSGMARSAAVVYPASCSQMAAGLD